ncbi:hypothetical protein F3K50_12420, partial [Pseudomonas marginalis]
EHLSHQLETDQLEFVVATLRADQAFDPRFAITHLPQQPASIFCRSAHPLAQQGGPISRAQILDYPWGGVVPSNEASLYAFGNAAAVDLEFQRLEPVARNHADQRLVALGLALMVGQRLVRRAVGELCATHKAWLARRPADHQKRRGASGRTYAVADRSTGR